MLVRMFFPHLKFWDIICHFLVQTTLFCPVSRAVALGLTADDMMAVQEFTEGLKTKKQQPESVATIIKREVAMEESQLRVRYK